MRRFSYMLLAVVWWFIGTSVYAQTNTAPWTLQREAEGISLFTRPSSTSLVHEAKAETIVTGNIDSALAVLMDLKQYVSTDPTVKHAEELAVVDSNDVYYYLISNMPFFLKDRDYVIRMHKSKTSQGYFLHYEAVEGIKPPVEGLKRVTNVTSYISLQEQPAPNSFRLIYKVVFGADESLSENSLLLKTANKMIPESTYDRLAALRKLVIDNGSVAKK